MSGSLQYDFLTIELDADLLSTPFAVQTSWYVVTGAACSGKTTLIGQLAGEGFETAKETARVYIELELAKGRTFEELFGNAADEIRMTVMQRRIERSLRASEVTFLDRALPDSLTFCRFCGLNPNGILADCFQHRYASVFVLDRLPFCQDGARLEHDVISDLQDEWLERDYGALGYEVVRVPVLPREERLAFVLDNVGVVGGDSVFSFLVT
jgi:predicted ATPase